MISDELSVLFWAYKISTKPANSVKRGRNGNQHHAKKMSPQSWQMLLDTLELWKKQASEA